MIKMVYNCDINHNNSIFYLPCSKKLLNKFNFNTIACYNF